MDAFVGLDLGTSATKGVLLSSDGRILAKESRPTELLRPRPGWVEFSSERCYELLCEVVRSLRRAEPADARITAIALSGATGNALLMDADGAPLGNAISWMDTRAADDWRVDPIVVALTDIHRIVGWPYFRGFPLVALAWLRRYRPDVYERADVAAMNITYMYHRLSGRFCMDHSTATTFYMQDQVKRQWHKPLLAWLGLRESQMPQLLRSGSAIGTITARAAEETGLPHGTTVVIGAFDHPSAARGVGILDPGEALLSCGTSWVGFYPAADRETAISQKMLADPFLSPAGPWGAMFSLPRVGDKVREFVDRTFSAEPSASARYARFSETAGRSPRGSSEPCRALMDTIVANMKVKMDALARAGLRADRIVMVGGPTESSVWTQALADELGHDIILPETGAFTGALGAAILAGIGAGVFVDERSAFQRITGGARTARPGAGRRQDR